MTRFTVHGVQPDEFPNQMETEPEQESNQHNPGGGIGFELVERPCKGGSEHGSDNSSFDKDV